MPTSTEFHLQADAAWDEIDHPLCRLKKKKRKKKNTAAPLFLGTHGQKARCFRKDPTTKFQLQTRFLNWIAHRSKTRFHDRFHM